jgi:hypothetical protein
MPTLQISPLPPFSAMVPNVDSFDYRVMVTDNVTSWVKGGILVSSFLSTPVSKFRGTSMVAMAQKN